MIYELKKLPHLPHYNGQVKGEVLKDIWLDLLMQQICPLPLLCFVSHSTDSLSFSLSLQLPGNQTLTVSSSPSFIRDFQNRKKKNLFKRRGLVVQTGGKRWDRVPEASSKWWPRTLTFLLGIYVFLTLPIPRKIL